MDDRPFFTKLNCTIFFTIVEIIVQFDLVRFIKKEAEEKPLGFLFFYPSLGNSTLIPQLFRIFFKASLGDSEKSKRNWATKTFSIFIFRLFSKSIISI